MSWTWAIRPDAQQAQSNALALILTVANRDDLGLARIVSQLGEADARWSLVAVSTLAGAMLRDSPVAIEHYRQLALDYSQSNV